MNKVILLVGILALNGCAYMGLTNKSAYDYDLNKDSQTRDAKGALQIGELQKSGITFTFSNTSKNTSKILWDESAIVGIDGQSHRVIHGETKLKDASASMPPTVLPIGATVSDMVTFADAPQMVAGTWLMGEIVPCSSKGSMCSRDDNYGKSLTVMLTVENNGKKQEYVAKLTLKPEQERTPASTSTKPTN